MTHAFTDDDNNNDDADDVNDNDEPPDDDNNKRDFDIHDFDDDDSSITSELEDADDDDGSMAKSTFSSACRINTTTTTTTPFPIPIIRSFPVPKFATVVLPFYKYCAANAPSQRDSVITFEMKSNDLPYTRNTSSNIASTIELHLSL